ncbi:M4 family metallopeptidase [Saccharicrinis sp. FJH62]|uniref:M4 family metallopeptidase n=1 Tax=Saccharicrinis sp. FJH62 TaxID=3344657 RepID=UPI0035D49EAA
MKKILACFMLVHVTILSISQELFNADANRIVPGSNYVKLDHQKGIISYIGFSDPNLKGVQATADGEKLKSALGLDETHSFRTYSEFSDQMGNSHIKYQQYLNGYPVEHMYYTVHRLNSLKSASGIYTPVTTRQQSITKMQMSDALQLALAEVPSEHYSPKTLDQQGKEVYYIKNEIPVLCYKFDVFSVDPLRREWIYVDVATGNVVAREDRIHINDVIGKASTMYSGEQSITTDYYGGYYRLQESGRGDGIRTYNMQRGTNYSSAIEFIDFDNIWNTTTNFDNAAYDVHFSTEATYDYFKDNFNRNSFDGNGGALISYVHYSTNFPNAFWNGEFMTYGDGDGVLYSPLTATEIVAHEITHGLTEHTAALVYLNESGALNESFSDIFGTAIDFAANPETANYLMGEQVKTDGSVIRSMKDPNSKSMPDTYKGNFWYTGVTDNGGVHYNSSVQNYWFYLLCEGGSGINDNDKSYSVQSIGMNHAAKIAYRTLTVYLTPTSDYADARFYSIKAAIDLYGECSNEVINVTNAWYAVGVGDPYGDAVTAGFLIDESISCSLPTFQQVQDQSTFAESYKWYVNDTMQSTDANPLLEFNLAGKNSIKLVVSGSVGCRTSDSLMLEDALFIYQNPEVKDPVFRPISYRSGSGGILYFELDSLANSSEDAMEGYQDFSCSHQITLTEGKCYDVEILTRGDESTYVWLDLNNDGAFDDKTELLVYVKNSKNRVREKFIIPHGKVYDKALRLRVASDLPSNLLINGSTNSMAGQYEDYGVVLKQNESIPVAEFTTLDSLPAVGQSVQFTNLSENLPSSFEWTFEGGIPEYSTEKEPIVSYRSPGDFQVKLKVGNNFGSDSIIKTSYIHVTNDNVMGLQSRSSASSGNIHDSGGPNGMYENNEKYSFLIAPACAEKIILSFFQLNIDYYDDYLYIYDGDSEQDVLLASITGTSYPAGNGVVASSGKMLLVFISDAVGYYDGFSASWSTVQTSGEPVPAADFTFEPDNDVPFASPVNFFSTSTGNIANWQWIIDDAHYMFDEKSGHSFFESGDHNVKLIVDNCSGADTITKIVSVQEAPEIKTEKDTLRNFLNYGDTLTDYLVIENAGDGELMLNAELSNTIKLNDVNRVPDFPESMYLPENSSFESESGFISISVDQLLDGDTVKKQISSRLTANSDLEGMNVLFMPAYSSYAYLVNNLLVSGAHVYAADAYYINEAYLDSIDVVVIDDNCSLGTMQINYIRNWISNGGNLIIDADNNTPYYNLILAESGITYTSVYSASGYATVQEHKITTGISSYYVASGSQASLEITDEAEKLIISGNGLCYAAYAKINSGSVLATSDESFYDGNITMDGHLQLVTNYINFIKTGLLDIVNLKKEQLIIPPHTSDSIGVLINAKDNFGGQYLSMLNIFCNDTAINTLQVPVIIDIVGTPVFDTNADGVLFNKVFVGQDSTLSVMINNTGSDDLRIDSITTSDTDISGRMLYNVLAPNEKANLAITFSPSLSDVYHDTVFIYTNESSPKGHEIYVVGNAVLPPVADIDPDSLEVQLFTNDTLISTVDISNTNGGSELLLSKARIKASGDNDLKTDLTGLKVYSISYYNSYIATVLTDLGAEVTVANSPDTMAMKDYDVILIDDYYYYNQESTFFNRWAKNGGGLFIDGESNISNFNIMLNGSNLTMSTVNCTSLTTTNIMDHPVTESIDKFYIYSAGGSVIANFPGIELINDGYQHIYAAADEFEKGRVLVTGGGCFPNLSLEGHTQLLLNGVAWLGNKVSWLEIVEEPDSVVNKGEKTHLSVRFDAKELGDTILEAEIVIPTNDPLMNPVKIPVSMKVNGMAILEMNKMHVDMFAYAGFSGSDTITLMNIGAEPLIIDNISTNNPVFKVSESKLKIEPGSVKLMHLAYLPQSAGADSTWLILKGNSMLGSVDSVRLYGVAEAPPVLSVTPESLYLTSQTNKIHHKVLKISNEEGLGELNFSIDAVKCSDCENPDSENTLESVLKGIQAGADRLTAKIPNAYAFSDGISGYYISDGGSDIYDGGNYLGTNRGSSIYYSNNTITTSPYLNGEEYFTSKQNGLFIFAANLNNVSTFSISGSLGMNSGSVSASELTTTYNGKTYKGFVKKVYGESYTPSVNHLIIMEYTAGVSQTYSNSYYSDLHTITNLNQCHRIYYLLFTGNNGLLYTDAQITELMTTFISIINPAPQWISFNSSETSGTISPGSFNNSDVAFNTNGLAYDTYTAYIRVKSNDPKWPVLHIPVTLEVVNNQSPVLSQSLPNMITYLDGDIPVDLDEYIVDPDGDVLTYSVKSNDHNIIFPTIDNNSMLHFNPQSIGYTNLVVTASDQISSPLDVQVDVLVKDNQKPEVVESLRDTVLKTHSEPWVVNMKQYFMDPDGDELSFNVVSSSETSLETVQNGYLLLVYPKRAGWNILTINAMDSRGATVSVSCIVKVENYVAVEEVERNKISIYPVPAKDELFISYDTYELPEVAQIVGLNGQVIADISSRIGLGLSRIDISGLNPGVYFLILKNRNSVTNHKIVIE